MPGKISTHVLDTSLGRPAAGMRVECFQLVGDRSTRVAQGTTNADGRLPELLVAEDGLPLGIYELRFHAGAYFQTTSPGLPDPSFLDLVPVRFGVAEAMGSYHVPLLVSPWAYSTYRGS
jgi:hydroxyisourate hydrolase